MEKSAARDALLNEFDRLTALADLYGQAGQDDLAAEAEHAAGQTARTIMAAWPGFPLMPAAYQAV